jgi:glycerol 3-phosphatase-2
MSSTLREEHDALLLDLDGTVYAGQDVVPGALAALQGSAQRLLYVTNNASRTPSAVAAHLSELGLPTTAADVVTSAQSAARLLGERLEPGAIVLVVGAPALVEEITAVGLVPVRGSDPVPAAVVQGHSPDTGWTSLAEATVAIRAGAVWVATNTDLTLPSARGLLPGNGSLVAAVRCATGQDPVVAGKPAMPLMEDALDRSGATAPLVVGDRLDTDIAGARAVGVRSLLVLTGVSTPLELLRAPEEHRPDLVAADLGGLDRPARELAIGDVDGWSVRADGSDLVLVCDDDAADPVAGLRAACRPSWDNPSWTVLRAEGAGAELALRFWGIEPG